MSVFYGVMEKVYVGVSGGVDSAAAVRILQEQGFEVTGVHLSMYGEDACDIAELSEELGVEVLTLNLRERFEREVITPFVKDYLQGYTPSPCTVCNPFIKWEVLRETALVQGGAGSRWATGHYCRIVEMNGLFYVARGADLIKDQSYYLWHLGQDVLCGALMPLGEVAKKDVKFRMEGEGLVRLANRKESMGVCFLKGKGYAAFLKERCPGLAALDGGEIVNKKGEVLGKHSGYPFYTLAQRRGLPIKKGECVVKIDASENRLIIGTPEELYCREIWLENWRVTNEDEFFSSLSLEVKVRGIGLNPTGYCRVAKEGARVHVELCDDRAWAVAKGQPAVFYIDDRVVGGGVVADAL